MAQTSILNIQTPKDLITQFPGTEKNKDIAPSPGLLSGEIPDCSRNKVPLNELFLDQTISKTNQYNHYCAGNFLSSGEAYFNSQIVKFEPNVNWAYDHYVRAAINPCKLGISDTRLGAVNNCFSSDVKFIEKTLSNSVIECNDGVFNLGDGIPQGSTCAWALMKIADIDAERAVNSPNSEIVARILRQLNKSYKLGNISALWSLADIYMSGNIVEMNHAFAFQLIEKTGTSKQNMEKIKSREYQRIKNDETAIVEQCSNRLANSQSRTLPEIKCSKRAFGGGNNGILQCDVYSKLDICSISLNSNRCSFSNSFTSYESYLKVLGKMSYDVGDKIVLNSNNCNILKVTITSMTGQNIELEF